MGRIQSNVGLITGINIEDTVNQLMELNSIPKKRLESRNELLDKERVAVTELMTLVVGVQLTTDQLGAKSLFDSVQVASSNPSLISATRNGSPVPGTYNFTPVRMAQTQQLASSTFASAQQKLTSGEIKIHTGGFLDRSVDLEQLNGGAGVSRGLIRIQDRSGASQAIDLRFAQNVQDVVDAINAADQVRVTAEIDGTRIRLVDTSGATSSNLQVTEVGGGTTAADLGLAGISVAADSAAGANIYQLSTATALRQIRDGRGLDIPPTGDALAFQLRDGTNFNVSLDFTSNDASLGQVLEAIEEASNGKVSARIAADGLRIEIEDLTTGGSSFAITSPTGDLANQLGLDNAAAGGIIRGDRLLAGMNDVLLSGLDGGLGIESLGTITITDRSGASDTVDLSTAETIGQVIDQINAASVRVQARLNRIRTGIELVDTTGDSASNLIVADADGSNTATRLQIAASTANDAIDSGSLNLQFVTRNTLLSDYNQGRGVTLGTIKITASNGVAASVNLSAKAPQTIGDVVDILNGLGLGIEAKINDTGDGILIVDTAGGAGALRIEDVQGGVAAAELGIAGTATAVTDGGNSASGIDGSRTIRISTSSTTTLEDLVDELNGLTNSPVQANLLQAGSGVRVLINSAAGGQAGRLAIDGGPIIGFSETAAGRDALLAFGATAETGGVLVTSSSNQFTNVVSGLDVSVSGTSTTPVAITVSKSDATIVDRIDKFVEQYNKLRDKYEDLTIYDATTNQVGILFGKGSALRVDSVFSRLITGTFPGAGPIRSLVQLGIRLNDQGRLEFDEDKFTAQYNADPDAVKEFFTAEDFGFSARARAVADSLAGVEGGSLLQRSNTLSAQIDANSARIETLQTRLDKQRERLLLEFYNMETTIARIQQNLSALDQLQIIPPLTA
ncbi:MAG: hypothetical protein KatS3mg111_0018 [Pirellulaceae bacterium]|nr:MAG: hypothetical protein KatS3mg111_0018 [Pirellulaceae bacterium]